MKKRITLGVVLMILFVCPSSLAVQGATGSKALAITQRPPEHKERETMPEKDTKIIENFEKYRDGEFPKWWKTWPLQRGAAHKVYQVKVEGNKHYLHAFDDNNYSQQIMKPFIWDIEKYPYLNWKWRPKVLPNGAAENNDKTNDSACGVYVVFGRYTGVATKYVWSSTLPVGHRIVRRKGKLRMRVVGSGQDGLGKWHSYSINVPESYAKLFEKKMGRKPTGIGILTDADITRSTGSCDYADFSISEKPLY